MPCSQSPDVFCDVRRKSNTFISTTWHRRAKDRNWKWRENFGNSFFTLAAIKLCKKCNFIYRFFYYSFFFRKRFGVNKRDKILAHEPRRRQSTCTRQSIDNFRRRSLQQWLAIRKEVHIVTTIAPDDVDSQQPRKEENLINKNIVERRQRLLMTTFELATGMFSFFLQSI